MKGTDRLLASSGQPAAEVRATLRELVPEYRPPGEGALGSSDATAWTRAGARGGWTRGGVD